MAFGNLAAAGGGGDLLDKEGDALGRVFNREGLPEDVAVAVATQGHMLALGVVEGDAENLAGIGGFLKNRPEKGVLVAVDGGRCGFHGILKMPLRQLQRASEAVGRAGALRAPPPASEGLCKRYRSRVLTLFIPFVPAGTVKPSPAEGCLGVP